MFASVLTVSGPTIPSASHQPATGMMLASVLAVSGVAVSQRNLRQGLRQLLVLRRLRAGNAIEQAGEVERC